MHQLRNFNNNSKKYVTFRGTKMQILWLKVEATKLLKRQNVDAATGQF